MKKVKMVDVLSFLFLKCKVGEFIEIKKCKMEKKKV
jgi:hypothetical protein